MLCTVSHRHSEWREQRQCPQNAEAVHKGGSLAQVGLGEASEHGWRVVYDLQSIQLRPQQWQRKRWQRLPNLRRRGQLDDGEADGEEVVVHRICCGALGQLGKVYGQVIWRAEAGVLVYGVELVFDNIPIKKADILQQVNKEYPLSVLNLTLKNSIKFAFKFLR